MRRAATSSEESTNTALPASEGRLRSPHGTVGLVYDYPFGLQGVIRCRNQSGMIVIERNGEDLVVAENWFDPAIEDDPWIVYHATSSVFEANIDSDGLCPASSIKFDEAIRLACSFFINTDFTGSAGSNCGYLELVGLGLPRIHGKSPPHLYFSLYPQRSPTYLMPDFCGGELMGGLARAIPAICQFAHDSDAIDMHFEQLQDLCIREVRAGCAPSVRVVRVNKDWARSVADQLAVFNIDLAAMRTAHSHGVLYAVQVNRELLVDAKYSSMDGLRICKEISPLQIVAKLRISNATVFSMNNLGWDPGRYSLTNRWRDSGELATYLDGKPQSFDDESLQQLSERLKRGLLDPQAGQDVTLELARQYGTEGVRKWADGPARML